METVYKYKSVWLVNSFPVIFKRIARTIKKSAIDFATFSLQFFLTIILRFFYGVKLEEETIKESDAVVEVI